MYDINISEEEKTIVKQYFTLLKEKHPELLTENGSLPDGTKLNFLKEQDKEVVESLINRTYNPEEQLRYDRNFVVPQPEGRSIVIPVSSIIKDSLESAANDEWQETHSVIWVQGDFIYLQNKLDAMPEHDESVLASSDTHHTEESDENADDSDLVEAEVSSDSSSLRYMQPAEEIEHQYLANGEFNKNTVRPKVKRGRIYSVTRDIKRCG